MKSVTQNGMTRCGCLLDIVSKQRRVLAVFALVTVTGVSASRAAEPDVTNWMHMQDKDWWKVGSSYTRANWLDPEDPSAAAVTIADSPKQLFFANCNLNTPSNQSTFPGTTLAIGSGVTFGPATGTHTINDLRLLGGSIVSCGNTRHKGHVIVYGDADHPVRYNTGTYQHKTWNIDAAFASDSSDVVINFGNDDSTKTRDYLLPASGNAETVAFNGSWLEFTGTLNLTKGTYYRLTSYFTGLPGKLKICGNAYVKHYIGEQLMTFGELELDDGAVWMLDHVGNDPRCLVTNRMTVVGNPLIYKNGTVTTNGYIDIVRLSGEAAKTANLPDVSGLRLDPLSTLDKLLRDFNPTFVIADGENGEKVVRLTWDALKYLTSNGGKSTSALDSDWGKGSYWTPQGLPDATDTGFYLMSSMYLKKWGDIAYPDTTVVCSGQTIYRNATTMNFKKVVFVGSSNNALTMASYGPDTCTWQAPLELRDATVAINGWVNRKGISTGAISGTGTINLTGRTDFSLVMNCDSSSFAGVLACSIDLISDGTLTGSARPDYYLSFGHKDALGGAYTGSTASWKATSFTRTWSRFTSDVTLDEPTRGIYFANMNVAEVDGDCAFTVGSEATYDGQFRKRGNGALVLAGEAPHFISEGTRTDVPVAASNVLTIAAGSLKVASTNAVNGLAITFAEGATWKVDAGATGDLKAFGAINTAWDAPFATEAASGKIALDIDVSGVAASTGAFAVAVCTVNKNAPALAFEFKTRKKGRSFAVTTRDNGDTLTYLMNVSAKEGLAIILR